MFVIPFDVDATCDVPAHWTYLRLSQRERRKRKQRQKQLPAFLCLVCLTFRSYRFVTPCDVDAMHVLENYVTCIYITEHIQGHCRSTDRRARAPT